MQATQVTARFSEATEYARAAHAGQLRKGTRIPYISHPLAVASLVLSCGGDEDQAIAALLHDVIEDCGAEHADAIRAKFGDTVADIVLACTDGTAERKAKPSDPEARRRDWWVRKLEYLENLKRKPDATLLVSGCDKLDNALAIVADLENPAVGLVVFDRFTAGRDGTLRYYHSLAQLLARRQVAMSARLEAAVARMHALAGATEPVELDHGVYRLRIWDNFHYMDETEAYITGWFLSAEEAIAEAKRRVLADLPETGATAEERFDHYTSFGEDPSIIGTPQVSFSAWTFAKEEAARLAGEPQVSILPAQGGEA